MLINEILDRFEANEREKQKQLEMEHQKEIARRRMIAGSLRNLLLRVIQPVLEEAEKMLSSRGYAAQVAIGRRTDPVVDRSVEVVMSLTLEIGQSKLNAFREFSIAYLGNFEEETLLRLVKADRDKPAIEKPPVPFSRITRETVVQDVEDFIGEVFGVKEP